MDALIRVDEALLGGAGGGGGDEGLVSANGGGGGDTAGVGEEEGGDAAVEKEEDGAAEEADDDGSEEEMQVDGGNANASDDLGTIVLSFSYFPLHVHAPDLIRMWHQSIGDPQSCICYFKSVGFQILAGCEMETHNEPKKSQADAWELANRLNENAQHIHMILSGEADEDGGHHNAPAYAVSPDAMETTRQKADELIKSLGGLVSYLNQFTDLIKENGIEDVVGVN
ncbi:hypothetical protein TRIUR3_14886 [Triticum urartu]|uniref:Uncharacterized protein n=1 Tax=Triticum urartu TaxID=4572 RepID=M7ZGX9_TRIUA|nr:hypothetical protein TRIUR3_14886 [Triticum urartu]